MRNLNFLQLARKAAGHLMRAQGTNNPRIRYNEIRCYDRASTRAIAAWDALPASERKLIHKCDGVFVSRKGGHAYLAWD